PPSVALVCVRGFPKRVKAVGDHPAASESVNPVFLGEFIRSKEFAPNTLAPPRARCSWPPAPIALRS
ncbi:MAG: hypothetical protein ACRDSS_09910, partial [Actinocrinis sp.]